MRLRPDLYLVGGGHAGFDLSAPLDCHVYLLDGGDELALVDAGLGIAGGVDDILANVEADGLDPRRISRLLLTHYHADHAGAAAEFAARLGLAVHGSPPTAAAISTADEEAISLPLAKRAGFYPESFHLRPCPVRGDLVEGARVELGRLTLTVFDTPGHCRGHVSFLLVGPHGTAFLGGDLVCHGGRVLMQNTQDCNIQDYAASVFKVEPLRFDALLPGHGSISLRDGSRHVALAAAAFRRLGLPENAL
jgi:glyoxylase-like metal-dependent hydrolase (beta-lactamase superfamily II)